jgi:hypothetical protein
VLAWLGSTALSIAELMCVRCLAEPRLPACLLAHANFVVLLYCCTCCTGGWSDTPDSACLALLDGIEQAAAGRLGGVVAAGPQPAATEASPVPARQLSFTPSRPGGVVAAAASAGVSGGRAGTTPLSGGSLPANQPTSHLGRSAQQAAAAAAAVPAGPEHAVPAPHPMQPLVQQSLGQQQPQPDAVLEAPGWQPDTFPAPPQLQPLQQQEAVPSTGEASLKRSFAATVALEQAAAQHSPAAARLHQQERRQLWQSPACPTTHGRPASKRVRIEADTQGQSEAAAAGAAAAVEPLQGQCEVAAASEGLQDHLPAPLDSIAVPPAVPPAVPAEAAAASFPYRECLLLLLLLRQCLPAADLLFAT